MARYSPIDGGVSLQASQSNLAALHREANGIAADFVLPNDEAYLLCVSFKRPCIIVLDERPLSTEEDDTPNERLVPEHFAYFPEGAVFARLQSLAWKEGNAPVNTFNSLQGGHSWTS